jgi:hypothetical protein
MRIVVEGSGNWAERYFKALVAHAGQHHGVFFTYDSTFGLDDHAHALSARLFVDYLQATLRYVEDIQKAEYSTLDVKDTLFRGKRNERRELFPTDADVVFVVTPDRTHCDVAEYWLGRARRIFVEKPFDVSARRIAQFRGRLGQHHTEVFAVDHYFVRCNQAAVDQDYFVKHLLAQGADGRLEGDFTSFEFRMTESPKVKDGHYDDTDVRRRALSLQAGMVFDLGSHAVPMLIPYFDLQRGIRLRDVWAGRSDRLRDIIFSGAETFSVAELECHTRGTETKRASSPVHGTFIVGKDIGRRPEKHFILRGPGGELKFDFVGYRVDHTSPGGVVTPVAPLYENWVDFFVAEVLAGRVPKAVERYQPEGAQRVVAFLEEWRGVCQRGSGGVARILAEHTPGASVADLRSPSYQVMAGGKRL